MGRGGRSGSSSSSGNELAPRRTKNERREDAGAEDTRGATGDRESHWRSQAAGDRKAAAMDSDEEEGGRPNRRHRSSDVKSSRNGQEGTSDRYEDERSKRYEREKESERRSRVRVDGPDRERDREKDRMDYEERRRFDSNRGRRDRYDPDTRRPELEKHQRTEKYRSDREAEERDPSYSRNEVGRERFKSDYDERRHRGKDYRLEDGGRDSLTAKDGERARHLGDSDNLSRARDKVSSRMQETGELASRDRGRESSRADKESELTAKGPENEEIIQEASLPRGKELARSGETSASEYGLEKEQESPRRGYGSRSESARGRGGFESKEEQMVDEVRNEQGRLVRRPRESSPNRNDIERKKGKRNESPEQRRVKARRDNEAERDAENDEDGAGQRGKRRKYRDNSSEEGERSLRRRVVDDRIPSKGEDTRDAAGASAGALGEENLNLSLSLQAGNELEARRDTVSAVYGQLVTSEVHHGGSLSKTIVDNRENPRLQISSDGKPQRIASPSPTTKPYLPSASESESGDSDSSRSASPGMSITPERAPFTKPTRATPDIRRGERSPNPSPLSPRSRLPPPGSLGALSPIISSKLMENGEVGDDDHAGIPSTVNGGEEGFKVNRFSGDLKSDVGEGERTLEEGETLDRWVPGDDEEQLNSYRGGNGLVSPEDGDRLTRFDRRESRHNDTERRDSERSGRVGARNDSNRREETVYGSGRGRHDDRVRSRGYQTPIAVDRYREDNVQRDRDDVERRVPKDGYREGHRRDGDQNITVRERNREPELKKGANGDTTRSRHETTGKINSGEQTEAKKVERQRPALPPGRSGGVYIPPFKLAQMLREVDGKSSNEYQRLTWDALRKSINGLVNKVNSSNLKNILPELFSENLIRGRGLFARSCMKSQMASPTFTHVFAALVAVVNTKFPELGELLLKRIILQLRRAFKRNDKPVLLAAAKFIAHLVNQQVAHEIIALELLTVLLENPTDDSVEVAVGFVKECGATLQNLSSQGLHAIFERFRGILHEGEIDKRVQFMIEGLFAIRKASFQGYAAVLPELDLVEQEDQITHELSLQDDFDDESYLDVFKPDPNFVEAEKKYEAIKKDILGDESDDEGGDNEDEEEDEDEEDEEDEDELEQRMQIQDETETNLVNLRRTIYLTIMSSVDFEEAGHKLLKIKLEPGQEMELCIMLLECCSQERTYLRYYGLLGQRFCMINRVYQENFDQCFVKQYSMIHRLETNKLRNVAKFFAHLLGTDALPWQALAYIRLTEEDTTSSSRIFIKILFQELSEHLGLRKLNERLSDPMMQESFDGIFPKDNPKNTRFAINFFTSIGLGGLTDSLREYLKNMPRLIMQQQPVLPSESEESSSSESDGTDSSTESESDTESDTVSDSSDGEDRKRRKKRK